MIELSFVTERSVGSEIIRWFSHSDFSHTEFIWSDLDSNAGMRGLRYGARSDNLKLPGVQFREPDYAKFTKDWRLLLPSTGEQDAKLYRFLLEQEGQPYDTTGLFASFLWNTPRDRSSTSSWWCSELVASALEAAGMVRILTPSTRITPNDAFILAGTIPGSHLIKVIP